MKMEHTIGQRILVIDDDEMIRELVGALLTAQGFEVTTVDSGDAALAVLASPDPPSMLLTDLQMPGLENEALTHALRAASSPETVLIGMSARQPGEKAMEPLDGFLLKPFDSTTLTAIFAAAVQERMRLKEQACNNPEGVDAPDSEYPILDEGIFSALGKSFQAPQLQEFYAMTLRDVHSRLERMNALAADNDLGELQREAHAIKGGCGMVGARELQGLAARLEMGTTVDATLLREIPLACDRLQSTVEAKLQQKW